MRPVVVFLCLRNLVTQWYIYPSPFSHQLHWTSGWSGASQPRNSKNLKGDGYGEWHTCRAWMAGKGSDFHLGGPWNLITRQDDHPSSACTQNYLRFPDKIPDSFDQTWLLCFLSSWLERFYGIQKRAPHLQLMSLGFEFQLCDFDSLLYPEALNFSFCSMGVIKVPALYWSVVKNK